jgi:hypothetical protein
MATQPEEPEEFFESEFVEGWWGWWSDRERKRITFTGFLWIAAPWWLIFRHRLKFGLGQLILLVLSLGSSFGWMLRGVLGQSDRLHDVLQIFLLYAVVHTFALFFVWAIYYWTFWPDSIRRYGLNGFSVTLLALIPPTLLWHLCAMLLLR